MISDGILVQDDNGGLRFSKPCIFNNLSTASAVILDRTGNGLMEWREVESGSSYQDWRQKEIENNGDTQRVHNSDDPGEIQFEIRHKSGIRATLVERNGKFVILEGSEAFPERNRVKHKYSGQSARKKMIDESILVSQGNDRLRLVKSCTCKSLSVAAGIVFGRSSSGPMEWKEKKSGLSYSDWQKKSVKGRKAENPVPEDPDIPSRDSITNDDVQFGIRHKSGVHATMIEKDGKFVVLEGSEALVDSGYARRGNKVPKTRMTMIIERVLVPHEQLRDRVCFARSWQFDSPSAASAMVLDRSSNGHKEWREVNSGLSYHDWRKQHATRC